MFEEQFEKLFKKTFRYIGLEENYPQKLINVIHFIAFSFVPFAFKIITVIVLIWIYIRINEKYGIDKVLIVSLAIIIITLRDILKKLS